MSLELGERLSRDIVTRPTANIETQLTYTAQPSLRQHQVLNYGGIFLRI